MKDPFIALGQLIKSKNLNNSDSIESTLNTIHDEFKATGDTFPNGLEYDSQSGWIVGLRYQPVAYIDMGVLLQDEYNRYALLLALDDDEIAGPFNGLKAEVQYEKKKGSVGRFTGAVKLPDSIRRIDLGAVKMTIPQLNFDLFRNGDFKVNVGFPNGLDFTQSLCIEAPPYIGWGGFYIGRKSQETAAYSKVPDDFNKEYGRFESIIEAGLAVKLGYGKKLDQGILQAGLSVTGIGILEGTVATFRAAANSNKKDDKFSWYSGVLGVSGNVFGQVDLEVLTAKVDCSVNTTANLIVESYKRSNVKFDFDVNASGEIEVNFLGAKGKVSKSFHKNLKLEFDMGDDDCGQWEDQCLAIAADSVAKEELIWKRIILPDNGLEDIKLSFIPHLSIDDGEGTIKAQCASMLYVAAPGINDMDCSFLTWLKGLFLWTVNAYLNRRDTDYIVLMDQYVDANQLMRIKQLLKTNVLAPQAPFDYDSDIVPFLKAYFKFLVCPPEMGDCTDNHASTSQSFVFFPMLPDFTLTVEQTEADGSIHLCESNFKTKNERTSQQVNWIKDHVRQSLVDPRTNAQRKFDGRNLVKPVSRPKSNSMCKHWIQDVMTFTIKSVLDLVADKIGEQAKKLKDVIEDDLFDVSDDSLRTLASMISCFALAGLHVKPNSSANPPAQPVYYEIGQLCSLKPNIKGLTIKLARGSNLSATMNACTEPAGDPDTLTVEYPACEIRLINELLNVQAPDETKEWLCIRPLQPYTEVPQSYSAKSAKTWSNGTDSKDVIVFPEALGSRLENKSLPPALKLFYRDKSTCTEIDRSQYELATLVTVKIIKTRFDSLYELQGATGYGQKLLERLARALPRSEASSDEVHLENLHILYSKDDKNWLSISEQPLIYRRNLTTFNEPKDTSPIANKLRAGAYTFASSLYRSGSVNSGGFYLWYTNKWDKMPTIPGDACEIQILLQYGSAAALASYTNTVLVSSSIANKAENFYWLDEPKVKVPVLLPGHLGLEVYRPKPAEDDSKPLSYVRRMFHLIGTQVVDNGSTGQQEPADVPIAPISVVDSLPCVKQTNSSNVKEEWLQYRSVLPLDINHSLAFTEDCQNHSDDPYGRIGKSIRIELTPRDSFGNVLASWKKSCAMTVLYRDFVVPVHQWPGTSLTYRLDKGLSLTLNLHFDPRELSDPCATKDIYETAFSHLSRADVKACLSLSIGIGQVEITSGLQQFALDCRNSLSNTSPAPIQRTLSVPYGMNGAIKQPVYELTVELSIVRTDLSLIDCDLRNVPEAISGTSQIVHEYRNKVKEKPDMPDSKEQDIQTLQQLAIVIEEGDFYKLAQGAWLEGIDANRLWIVGISENGCVNLNMEDGTFLYAAAPLETIKCKRSYIVESYDSFGRSAGMVDDKLLYVEQESDLDRWLSESLAFVDQMLNPPYLQLIGNIDKGDTLEKILLIKAKLAEHYTSNVGHLGELAHSDDSQRADLTSARSRFKDAMLVDLSAAFDQDTVVQQILRVQAPEVNPEELKFINLYGTIEAEVFGVVESESSIITTKVQATFSKAKVSLSNTTNALTYLFDVKDAGQFSRYQANCGKFIATHVEKAITDSTGFTSSSWIELVHPRVIELGDQTIPCAIKGHPVPPELTRHEWTVNEVTSDLELIRKWDYTLAYKRGHDSVDQDQVKFEIGWNEEASPIALVDDDKLTQSLAQFRHIMMDIRTNMQSQENAVVTKAVHCLERGIRNIADNWLARFQQRLPQAQSTSLVTRFDIWTRLSAPHAGTVEEPVFEIVLGHVAGPIPETGIQIQLEGYMAERTKSIGDTVAFRYYTEEIKEGVTGKRYLTQPIPADSEVTIMIRGIDILDYHSSRVSLYQTRNEALLKGCPSYKEQTAEPFVYRTPRVKSADPASPLIRSKTSIDFSGLLSQSEPKTVGNHIRKLLQTLFRSESNALNAHLLVCSAVYRYPYLTDKVELSIPICLKHAFFYKENEASVEAFCRELADCLQREDGPLLGEGKIVVNLRVYPETEEARPILSMSGLELPLNKIDSHLEE